MPFKTNISCKLKYELVCASDGDKFFFFQHFKLFRCVCGLDCSSFCYEVSLCYLFVSEFKSSLFSAFGSAKG